MQYMYLSFVNNKCEMLKTKNFSNSLLQSLHFSFCIMMEKPNAFIKMNFDKLGCMVLVELFHNSCIGALSIPRIIEREQHYVI
jgi:hypothetical protein